MESLNPAQLEIMKNAFTAIPEQMGASLQRSSHSPNIKERKDESCAIFTSERELLAQAEHIPVHLGAIPKSIEHAVESCEMNQGDQIILNDPYSGGTHLPDITLIKPVYDKERHLGYVVNRAHHADIGGETPGSMPGKAERIEEEGIIISPTHIVKEGEYVDRIISLIQEARSPKERWGDIRAQIGANERGAKEFRKAVKRFGLKRYIAFVRQILDYSENRTRSVIGDLQNGTSSDWDLMEWDEEVRLEVTIEIKDGKVNFNFSGTSDQVEGNINAPEPVTLSGVYYVLRCLLGADIPVNEGCHRPIKVVIPEGSLLNPKWPAAVSAGNVETSQRVVELLFKTLRFLLPDTIPAESQGTMNNLTIGNDQFSYYETVGGGAGASSKGAGESGVQVHMTNTKNTPIESIENNYPLCVTSYCIREESGGDGLFPGGCGLIREIEFLDDRAILSIQSERRKYRPKGVEGGGDGKRGKNLIIRDGIVEELPGKVTLPIRKGEKVRIETPGGGGWGSKK